VRFGEELFGQPLVRVASTIKTYSEQIDDAKFVEQLKTTMAAAKQIVFLGFGFHDPNMSLLEAPANGATRRIYSTAVGFSSSDVEDIEQQIVRLFDDSPTRPAVLNVRNDLDCSGLFREYRKALSH